ncbi:MAG: homocysteine S-methyltransferase family protein [Oscillospiraceae bacterium]
MEKTDYILLDGAMGTMLQAAGLGIGELPESWNITHPDRVAAIQRRYVDAGSDILFANTFGANRHKTAKSGYTPTELIAGAIRCARDAAGDKPVKVALDIGPIGQLLEPLGTLPFEEAYDTYKEMVIAGEEAGADLIVFETMSDLYEVKAAVLAAKENTKLPVWVTMTFEATGRTFVGTSIPAMALTLTGLGVDAMGFNCSLGPKELLPMMEELSHWTDVPLILKPNAGLPDPATGAYTITPEEFAGELAKAAALGVTAFGGCCGTTPDFIRALSAALKNTPAGTRRKADRRGVCSASQVAAYGGVRVIGERINPTGKRRFQQALRENDIGYILERGLEQQDAGADILDVNVGLPGIDEPAMMARVVKQLQSVVDLPLQIDSSDPAAIEAGLRAVNGRAIVNSVNGKAEVLDSILPLCQKYGAAVVGLCLDENGIPETAEGRIAIAQRILDAALAHGIPREDIFIDCLTLTVSAQQEQARETLKAVRVVTEDLGLHTVLGVSNISFGLPQREHITVSFLTQAMHAGLDFPILNPNQSAVMDAVASFKVLSCQDRDSEAYIARFAQAASAAPAPVQAAAQMTIADAIAKGLREETASLTKAALETMSELDVVNTQLIPALDLVGERYEKQEIFLPQLINAANAACEGFEVVKSRIAQRGEGSVSKGKILIATVHGDIHDIGKNIVKVVLENYGYTVIDLGRDVPKEVIVEAAIREDVKLVGLSALMTTTVASMAETIAALRASGHDCKIMVGGAVLTPDYAAEIGADYYSKDAKQSADIAKLVLG